MSVKPPAWLGKRGAARCVAGRSGVLPSVGRGCSWPTGGGSVAGARAVRPLVSACAVGCVLQAWLPGFAEAATVC